MKIKNKLDWLQFSHHDVKNWWAITPQPKKMDSFGEEIKPFPNYDRARKLLPAGRIDWSEDQRQGVLITLTGADISEWTGIGTDTQYLIDFAANNGKVGRIDFAIDWLEPMETVSPLWMTLKNHMGMNWHKSRIKKHMPIKPDDNSGWTQYLGKPKSDRRIRIYDKGRQMQKLWEAMQSVQPQSQEWTRVEFQNRRQFADRLCKDMSTYGWQSAGRAALKKALDFPDVQRYQSGMMHGEVDLTLSKRPPSKFWKWLDGQVASSIENHARDLEDNQRLIRYLHFMINKVEKIALEEFYSGESD